MLATRTASDRQTPNKPHTDEPPGPAYRPTLPVKIDGHRLVERRTYELKRLRRQFNDVVVRPSRFQDASVQPWLVQGYIPVQQRWCPRLERDIQSVCAEAGLSRTAAASIVRAASSGTISANPGVLLSRLLRFQDCLSEPLGRRGVLAALRTAPSLLRYSPESLRWNADMLASLLPDGTLPGVVSRAPMLLPASAITLWGNFEGLRSLLRLDHDAALRLAVRAPRLLLNTRGALLGRLQELVRLSGEPPRRVVELLARQPALLGYLPGTLERNLRHAGALLGVPFSRVQRLLAKQPALAMLSRGTLSDRVVRLRATLDLADAPADLASVVLRQPALLTLAPDAVAAKVAVVARVLGLEGRPEALRCVVRGAPQLLTLSAGSIEAKAAALRAAVAPCGALAAQLERAPPLSVAVWLCLSSRRYEHVRAVAEAAAAAEAAGAVPCGTGCGADVSAARQAGLGLGSGGGELLPGPVGALVPARAAPQPVAADGPGGGGSGPEPAVSCSSQQEPEHGACRRGRGRPRRQRPEPIPGAQAAEEGTVRGGDGSGNGGMEAGGEQHPGGSGRRPRLSLYALLKEAPGAGATTVAAEATGAATAAAARRGAVTAVTRTRRRAASRGRPASSD